MASPPADDQDTPTPPRTRDRPSRLIDIAVALVFLVADVVIVVVAALLFVMVGMGSAKPSNPSATVRSHDVPVLTWLVVWGVPALAVTGAVVHARLRMPVSALIQSLFALASTFLAVIWTRMLLS
ncbi:hypothetical protein ACH4GM_31915 [Streptomyces coeruleorubidus]|uniref:hypothetical protein n=1 Tax=Streptomyces coeruleorubidus TaxID=116188 RepID=UPI0037A127D4